jgi:PHD/YefM family antitoxin component YafN of YafNO toxin-antitoxin module
MLKKNGRNEFVVLPYEEFQALQERLLDAADLLTLRRARRADNPRKQVLTLDNLTKRLGLSSRPRRGRRPRTT